MPLHLRSWVCAPRFVATSTDAEYTQRMQRILALALCALVINLPMSAQAATCTPTSASTEGPYYVASKVRKNIIDKQPGTRTNLTISVVDANCKPIPDARVDIWHANAAGKYSAVDGNTQNFLRGSQVTNAQGQATFVTIFPGWYPGRVMHIHVKVLKDGDEVLTSQLYARDAQVAKIYAKGAYKSRGDQDTTLTTDRILRGTPNLMTLKIGSTIQASARLVIG